MLLVGTVIAPHPEDAATTQIPTLRGTVGRMKDQPTDNGYGCAEGDLMPTVPVGRWPVRTAAEADALVAKTIAYEDDGRQRAAWRRSINLLVGSPGGQTPAEKSMGNWYLTHACQSTARQINPLWQVRSIYHIASSPWYVPDGSLHDQSLAFLNQGQAFTFHLGHSSPDGFWSEGARFLDRRDWQQLNMPRGGGVLVTCGCYSCSLDPLGRDGHEGYGLAAIRNPGGPVAVIGASAESYSVAGVTAFNGLLRGFATDKLPQRLGQAWLDLKDGIANGPVDFFTFEMLDFGDGSNGAIPLATQRREHLEMWTLLGDPALRLPQVAPEIALHGPESAKPGDVVTLHGELPGGMKTATVHVTLERPLDAVPAGLDPVPATDGPQRDAVIMSNFRKAGNYVLSGQDVVVRGGQFEADVKMPAAAALNAVVVRVVAIDGKQQAVGVMRLTLHR